MIAAVHLIALLGTVSSSVGTARIWQQSFRGDCNHRAARHCRPDEPGIITAAHMQLLFVVLYNQ